MLTPEGRIKKEVRRILENHQVYYFMPTGIGYCRSGIPDIVACVNGQFMGIEVKAGDRKPTNLQQRELNKIVDAGGVSLCINANNINSLASYLQLVKLG